jgi:flavin-dependent dehydrogenase
MNGSEECFDVVVVGGRCAGAATGLLLARAGLRVLVAERSAQGSDTLSGHMIKPDGVGRLAAWGVLPDLLASGCPPVTGAEFTLDGRREPRPEPVPGALPPMAPRRTILDRLLQQHACDAGAHVRHRSTFRGWRAGAVSLDGGRQVRTRLLIGADGRRSAVASAVGAPYTDRRPGRSCAWYGYWDGAALTGLRAELRPGVFAGAFPTHGEQVLAFVQLPVTGWRHDHGEQDYHAGLRRCPTIASALAGARLPGRLLGAKDLPTYFRQAAGTGWALVGDAAHHKDPLAARGIADAFLGAQLLAEHVLRGWDHDLDQALRCYAADLIRLLAPTAELNDQLAGLDQPTTRTRAALHALWAAEHQIATGPPAARGRRTRQHRPSGSTVNRPGEPR